MPNRHRQAWPIGLPFRLSHSGPPVTPQQGVLIVRLNAPRSARDAAQPRPSSARYLPSQHAKSSTDACRLTTLCRRGPRPSYRRDRFCDDEPSSRHPTREFMSKTLFITGASTGLGRALAQTALADGHRVIGTVRNESARAEFDRLVAGSFVRPDPRRDRHRRHQAARRRHRARHRRHRRPRQQCRLRPRGHSRRNAAGRGAPSVRGQRVRRHRGHSGGAAAHAPAAIRPHHQHHLDGRLHHLSGHRHLQRQQIRAGGHLRQPQPKRSRTWASP